MMRTLVYVAWVLNISHLWAFSIEVQKLPTDLLSQRSKRQAESNIIEGPASIQVACIQMISESGEFVYVSAGSHDVCALYMIGLPDQLIQLDFLELNVDCEDGGLLAIVDGWETQGQFFPNAIDHPAPPEDQYRTHCGSDVPSRTIVTSQNVALVQSRVPRSGQGYSVRVRFLANPEPCNVISLHQEGVYTLSNHGQRRNCTLSVLSPEQVALLAVNVGSRASVLGQPQDNGLKYRCERHGLEDYVELRAGSGLDPAGMWRQLDLCGYDMSGDVSTYRLPCHNSVIRLISSGRFYNSVTIRFQQITAAQPDQFGRGIC